MWSVMNERDLEARVMGQQVQMGVEDVVALIWNEIVEKQMQVGENIGETFAIDVDKIEVDLEKLFSW
jgi:hypothetical protein